MTQGPGDWVDNDAFVMPELPAGLKVDPLVAALLHVTAFLELSGDGAVNPDAAVAGMEHVGHYLQQLAPDQVEKLRAQITQVAEHASNQYWGAAATEFFAEYLDNFGVGGDDE